MVRPLRKPKKKEITPVLDKYNDPERECARRIKSGNYVTVLPPISTGQNIWSGSSRR